MCMLSRLTMTVPSRFRHDHGVEIDPRGARGHNCPILDSCFPGAVWLGLGLACLISPLLAQEATADSVPRHQVVYHGPVEVQRRAAPLRALLTLFGLHRDRPTADLVLENRGELPVRLSDAGSMLTGATGHQLLSVMVGPDTGLVVNPGALTPVSACIVNVVATSSTSWNGRALSSPLRTSSC